MNSQSKNNSQHHHNTSSSFDFHPSAILFGNNDFSVSTNSSTGLISLSVSVSLLFMSFLVDIPCLIAVFRCRPKLTHTEFCILIVNNGLVFLLKLCATIFNLLNVELSSHRAEFCLAKYVVSVETFFTYYAVLFYYSMFHLTLLKRTGLFQRLFDLVHSTVSFLAFMGIVVFGFGTFLIVFTVFTNQLSDPGQTLDKCFENAGVAVFIPLMFLNISYVTVFVYLIATLIIWFSRVKASPSIVRKASLTTADMSKHRKNLSLLVKFALYSSYTCLLSLAQNLPVVLLYSLDNIDAPLLNQITSYVFNFFIFFHPVFLVLIHNIMRREISIMVRLVLGKIRGQTLQAVVEKTSSLATHS